MGSDLIVDRRGYSGHTSPKGRGFPLGWMVRISAVLHQDSLVPTSPIEPILAYCIHLILWGSGAIFIHHMCKARAPSALNTAAQLLAIVVVAGLTFLVSDPPNIFQDFREAYFAAGSAVLRGPSELISELQRGVEGFVNLPLIAYLFAPFALLPDKVAAVLFTLVGLLCIALAWWMLSRALNLGRPDSMLLLLLFAACGPLHNSVKEGNTSHLILTLLIGAFWALKQHRELAAGVLLGLAALLKPPLLLLGVYFFLRGRWRIVSGGAIACSLAALLSLLIFGWTAHVTWYSHVLAPYSDGQILAFNVQSMRAFVGRLVFEPAVLTDWSLQQLPEYARHASTAATLALVGVTITAFMRRQSSAQDAEVLDLEFSMVLVLACLISPVSWSHYYCWLLIPIAVLMAPRRQQFAWPDRSVVYLCAALLLPPILVVGQPVQGSWLYAKILVSSLFFSGLIAAFLLLRARWKTAA